MKYVVSDSPLRVVAAVIWDALTLSLSGRKRSMSGAALVATVLLVSVAACGGDESLGAIRLTEIFTQVPHDIRDGDQSRAEQGLLMLDDFRTGWTEEDPNYGDDSPVLTCFQDLDLSGLTVTGIAESNAFSVVGGTLYPDQFQRSSGVNRRQTRPTAV